MVQPILPQIKNVVFLMLENRSLDNVLGWLYQTPTGKAAEAPQHVTPGTSPSYDGLVAGRYSNPAYTWTGRVEQYPVAPVPGNLGTDQDRVPAYDPYEEMKAEGCWKGVLNQLYGNQNTITRLPNPEQGLAGMQGFLQDYYANYMLGWQGLDSLWAYTPQQLPVINGLARNFAVSDRWFCSVPTQTNPNRAYSLCGTSLGRENNLNLFAVEQFDRPTVFNYLARAGKSWGLYFTDTWKEGKSFTEYTFPHISKAVGNSDIGNISKFFERARNGTLPNFTYLEPTWGYGKGAFFKQGTDYHPPAHVGPAEQFLAQVYSAVRSSPQWGETLLIVTFDEHGGTYDHVAPPWGAKNPDGKIGADGFQFNLYGVRVPTLLISPFVRPGSVFRAPQPDKPFDHTSFIKTLLLWAGVDPGSVDLGLRMPLAPTFEDAMAPNHVNSGEHLGQASAKRALLTASPADDVSAAAGGGKPLNALFEGVDGAATRAIIASADLATIHAEVERYRKDPEQFEAELAPTA